MNDIGCQTSYFFDPSLFFSKKQGRKQRGVAKGFGGPLASSKRKEVMRMTGFEGMTPEMEPIPQTQGDFPQGCGIGLSVPPLPQEEEEEE